MSGRQLIIAVGREFGSAGHLIAERLAEHFSLQLYDKNFLEEILKDKGIDNDKIHQYDEKHKRFGMYRTVRGMESSPEAIIANMQFEYLKKKKIKVVWTMHDNWAITGHCAYFDLRKCEKWKSGCGDFRRFFEKYPAPGRKSVFRRSAHHKIR